MYLKVSALVSICAIFSLNLTLISKRVSHWSPCHTFSNKRGGMESPLELNREREREPQRDPRSCCLLDTWLLPRHEQNSAMKHQVVSTRVVTDSATTACSPFYRPAGGSSPNAPPMPCLRSITRHAFGECLQRCYGYHDRWYSLQLFIQVLRPGCTRRVPFESFHR